MDLRYRVNKCYCGTGLWGWLFRRLTTERCLLLTLLVLWLPGEVGAELVQHIANGLKPHLARDLTVPIPADFDRLSNDSTIIFKDIHSTDRFLFTTTRALFPGEDFEITLGGFSPGTTYDIQVRINNAGNTALNEIITFTTAEEPQQEVRTLLMVIDEELSDPELEIQYDQYAEDVLRQEQNIRIEKYYITDSIAAKRALYDEIIARYFSDNLYHLFFIGSNAEFPVEIYLLDAQGDETNSYFYKGFSFYTHVWNNLFVYDQERDAHVLVSGLNTSSTPDLYTPYRNNSSMAEISFGAFVPTSDLFAERKQQIIGYLQKVRKYRAGVIGFAKSALYSDTMWGNDYIQGPLDLLPRWTNNVAIATTHEPDPDYQGTDDQWEADYLGQLEYGSYEVGWINVHGIPTFHYFGISSGDIAALPSLNVGYISMQSCSTGDYSTSSYLAGTYLNRGNVLAVEANQNVTFYVQSAVTDFSPFHTLYEIAAGKRIGDAVRQHGPVFIGHVLFGDPMLILQQNTQLNLQDAVVALQVAAGRHPPVHLLPVDLTGDDRVGIQDALHIMTTLSVE